MARGGKREGAGRPPGATTKVGIELKEAAQAYTTQALSVLASIMNTMTEPASARVSAANAILDRAHGKPAQAITGADGAPLPQVMIFQLPDNGRGTT